MDTKEILLQLRTQKGLSQEELAEQVFVTRQAVSEYCKWCYTDGEFKYSSKEQLIDFCVEHMASDAWPKEQVRAHMEAVVPELRHWKK